MDILESNGLTHFNKIPLGKCIFNIHKYLSDKLPNRIHFNHLKRTNVLCLHDINQNNLKSIKLKSNYQRKGESSIFNYNLNSIKKISGFKVHKVDIWNVGSIVKEEIEYCINAVKYFTHKPKPRSKSPDLTVPPSFAPLIPPPDDEPSVVINNPESESSKEISLKL